MRKRMTGVVLIVWMVVIFAFSAQPAVQSAQTSRSTAYQIAEWQNNLLGRDKTKQELLGQAESMQLVVRKGAHMGEFAVLAILFFLHLSCYPISRKHRALLAWGLTAAYAASDELHQLFVPGRSGRFTDVCIDSLGGMAGIVFCLCVLWFCRKHEKV
ncbi:MAG: VanZ family protein [Lachnospiraceae bacterium]|jgi:VanZ family protein|nr:VanZ family protein [Lachnospiraceae bacterium]